VRVSRVSIVLIALAIAGGIAAWMLQRRLDRGEAESQTYVPKPVTMTPELELLKQYVQIDTTNPPGNETAGAKFLGALLQKNGIAFEIVESAPGRGSLYARIKGTKTGDGLMLVHHIDVMPASPKGWMRRPFAGDIYALRSSTLRAAVAHRSMTSCCSRSQMKSAAARWAWSGCSPIARTFSKASATRSTRAASPRCRASR
jgi:hypothetical protein